MKDLRKQLKDAQKDVREMKLLLDMFKTLPKEQRDKAQLMAAEKKVSKGLYFDKLSKEGARVLVSQYIYIFERKLYLDCHSNPKFDFWLFYLGNSLPLVVQRYGLSNLYF